MRSSSSGMFQPRSAETTTLSAARAPMVGFRVLLREERGRYRVHPAVMWKGELAKREKVAAMTPDLTLIEGGKALAD